MGIVLVAELGSRQKTPTELCKGAGPDHSIHHRARDILEKCVTQTVAIGVPRASCGPADGKGGSVANR